MKKIAFVIDSLYNSGGMERSSSLLASALADHYEVTMITGLQMGKPLFYPLSSKISVVDLGLAGNGYEGLSARSSLKRDYKFRLSEFLHAHPQEVVISLGGITQYFLPQIKDGSKKILWFKFAIDIYKYWTANIPNPIVRRLTALVQKYRMIYYARQFDTIVVLTDHDQHEWGRFTRKAQRIYNPLTISDPQLSDCTEKRAIAVGRLSFEKGFDMLVRAWKPVYEQHPDWKLFIFGEGEERPRLEQIRSELGLDDVVLLPGRTKAIASEYKQSALLVLPSRLEGFGNVIVEAEACGLPIVAFRCPFGPQEVVADQQNGFLVAPNDEAEMARRINQLIADETLRKRMGQESLRVVRRFNINTIKSEWIQLIEHLSISTHGTSK